MTAAFQKLEWSMNDNIKLHVRHWPVDKPVAAVCLVHGISEHAGRYQHVAEFLNGQKVTVIAPDLRGHGLSEGKSGHVASYEHWMQDLAVIEKMFRDIAAASPAVLYGHSMGGNLVLNYAMRSECGFDRLVATSPMIEPAFQPPWWKFALARTVGKFKPDLKVPTGLDDRQLTSDPEKLQAFRDDKLIKHYISVKLGLTLIESGKWLLQNTHRLRHPTLLMHGDADLITSHRKSSEFSEAVGKHCSFQSWPGMLHEIHNEVGRDRVLDRIGRWVTGGSETAA